MKDRREAVLSLLCREEPGAVIARHYGVSETSLYRWRDEFLAAGEAALAGGTRGKDDGPPDGALIRQCDRCGCSDAMPGRDGCTWTS